MNKRRVVSLKSTIFLYPIMALHLHVFEDDVLLLGDCLNFNGNWTLQPVGEHLFRVTEQKVYFLWCNRSAQDERYSDVIELSLNNHFAAHLIVKCASYELSNEHILGDCLIGSKSIL